MDLCKLLNYEIGKLKRYLNSRQLKSCFKPEAMGHIAQLSNNCFIQAFKGYCAMWLLGRLTIKGCNGHKGVEHFVYINENEWLIFFRKFGPVLHVMKEQLVLLLQKHFLNSSLGQSVSPESLNSLLFILKN